MSTVKHNVINLFVFLLFTSCISSQYVKKSNDVFDDSLKALDEKYGQGKFQTLPDEAGAAWILPDGTMNIKFPLSDTSHFSYKELKSYLRKNTIPKRMVVVMSKIQTPKLEDARGYIELFNNSGSRTIVVGNENQLDESFYSTYKYARIYSTGKGDYELDHNGITVQGDAELIADWISILGVENVAFYPDDKMKWNDAALIMNSAKARGIRNFSICTLLYNTSNDLAINRKEKSYYQMTFIPSDIKIDDTDQNMTLLNVERWLSERLSEDSKIDAVKIVDWPKVFFDPDMEMKVKTAIFKEDEFVLVLTRQGLGRNCWYKPDMNASIIANGKEYRLIKDEGFEDFSCFPYNPEYGYSNGCLCWVPENGIILNTLHFEAIPINTEYVDFVGTREYCFYGIQLGETNRFSDTEVINSMMLRTPISLNGTKGGDALIINRIEQSPNETTIGLNVFINADFTYKAHFGSDFKLTLADGTIVKALRIEGVPTDTDYIRAGDMVVEYPRIVFPKIPEIQLKNIRLTGTICHSSIDVSFGYERPSQYDGLFF